MAFDNYKKINNDNNVLSLGDYISICNSDIERQNLFFHMDISMKKLHDNNYYIKSFDVNDIYVYDDDNIIDVYYSSVDRGLDLSLKQKNIFYLSCLAIGVYSDCLKYIDPSKNEFLVNNFGEFSLFIPVDSVPYYRGVIVNKASVYYSDFITAKKNREIQSLQSMGDSSRQKAGTVLTKSTLVGKMNATDDNNQAAFISILLFPLIIFCIGFIIPFFLFLFS